MLKKILTWFRENAPAPCQRCGRAVRQKNLKSAHSVLGMVVRLCPECHAEIFRPFGWNDET